MFKFQLVAAAVLLTLTVAGCSKTSTSSNPASNPAPKTTPNPADVVPSIPTSGAQPSDQNQQGQVNQQVPQIPTIPTTNPSDNSPVQQPAAPTKPVVVKPAPAPAPGALTVTGLGSATRDPKDLTDQGISAAIFEARFCAVTGKFSDGSECYAVYSDGSNQSVNSGNRDQVQAYIDGLKAQLNQPSPKKSKKNPS